MDIFKVPARTTHHPAEVKQLDQATVIDFNHQSRILMNTYFTPLRRKIGIATLAVACQLMSAWTFAGIVLRDTDGNLSFCYTDEFRRSADDEHRYHLSFNKNHFSIDEIYRGIYIERTFKLEYWKATIPLTLLSAWLLLSTPRTKKCPSPRPESLPNAHSFCPAGDTRK